MGTSTPERSSQRPTTTSLPDRKRLPLELDAVVASSQSPTGMIGVVKSFGKHNRELQLPLYNAPYREPGSNVFLAKTRSGRLVQLPNEYTQEQVDLLNSEGAQLIKRSQRKDPGNTTLGKPNFRSPSFQISKPHQLPADPEEIGDYEVGFAKIPKRISKRRSYKPYRPRHSRW